mmetsp:Transcript_4222/g.16211  ORF Transcript_4222/g.16211 Transcript_4222/m.16211 type:complete len:245 (-) Transcript_4222:117-851(-)
MNAAHPGLWFNISAHGTSASSPPMASKRIKRLKRISNAHRSAPTVISGKYERISSIAALTLSCRSAAAKRDGDPFKSLSTSSSGQSNTLPVRRGSALMYSPNVPAVPLSNASACCAKNVASTLHSCNSACFGPNFASAIARSTVISVVLGTPSNASPRLISSVATNPRPSARFTSSAIFCPGRRRPSSHRASSAFVALPTPRGISASSYRALSARPRVDVVSSVDAAPPIVPARRRLPRHRRRR